MTAAAVASMPRPADRLGGGLVLAVLVHCAILGMLVWNFHFQSDDAPSVASAEIWSSVPQIAAPRAQQPPPTPAPPTPPPPVVKPEQPPPDDTVRLRRDADIAVAQQKAKEAEQAEREQRLAQQRKAEAKAEAAERAAQKARQKQADQDAQRKLADADAKAKAVAREATDSRQARREDDARERQRLENLRRITGLAGATGEAGATGTALRSAGFSASYAGRIAGRIKPNVVFPDALQGNPAVEVELRMSPDGHIAARRITKPSGVAEWDQAVLRALDRTEILPADEQGRVPPTMTLIFRPKDLGA